MILALSCSTIPVKFSLDNLTITPSFTTGYTLFIKCNSGVLHPCLIWFRYRSHCMKFFLWGSLFFPFDTNLGQIRSVVVFLSELLSNTNAKSDLVTCISQESAKWNVDPIFPCYLLRIIPAIIAHVTQRRPTLPEFFVICPFLSLSYSFS